jgi:hypothetical protein
MKMASLLLALLLNIASSAAIACDNDRCNKNCDPAKADCKP